MVKIILTLTLLASMRSTSSSSPMSPGDESRAASSRSGCAERISGSIQVRCARSTTSGFALTVPCPSKTFPVTVK